MESAIKNKTIPITVLMSVYNSSTHLMEAIDSILNQTFIDFEFLIINDGSTDTTSNILESLKDHRIRIVKNSTNKGLIYSLNKGLSLSKGKYIVRMDSDDISHPNRLQKQWNFMEKNSYTDICGSFSNVIGTREVRRPPTNYIKCWLELLVNNVISHPSVIIRRDSLIKNNLFYSNEYLHSEDYDLWVRCSMKKMRIENIAEVLLYYRIHENQVSQKYLTIQLHAAKEIRKKYLAYCWPYQSADDLELICNLVENKIISIKDFILFRDRIIKKSILSYGSCNEINLEKFMLKLYQKNICSAISSNCVLTNKKEFFFIIIKKYFWFKLSLRKKIYFLNDNIHLIFK